jgi:hypothetical protein
MALALFPVFSIVAPSTLDSAIAHPELLLITSKQRGVAFVALDILIGTVILTIVPCWIPRAVIAVCNPPRSIGRISRAAQHKQ